MREATMGCTADMLCALPITLGYGCTIRGQGVRVWTE